jgi:hypothetical protein
MDVNSKEIARQAPEPWCQSDATLELTKSPPKYRLSKIGWNLDVRQRLIFYVNRFRQARRQRRNRLLLIL